MKNRASYTLEIFKIFIFSFFYHFGYHCIHHFVYHLFYHLHFLSFFIIFFIIFFPTCQVRVVRFYVSCLLLSSSPLLLSSPPPPAQPRPSTHSGFCRTSTTTIHAQCSLPDLNHDHHRQCSLPDLNRGYPRPVFPAGPQPRPSTPSVPCRTSTASIHAKCSLPDLM